MRVREFAVPLQAFLAITICFSLVWMIYAMAFFDATPPTAAELGSLSTQDPEINELKTAAAMTVNAMFGIGPTQILLLVGTPTFPPTTTATIRASFTAFIPTTAAPTSTSVVQVTRTQRESTDPDPATATATATVRPTLTYTAVPTNTTAPSPTFTLTPVPPTATEQPPEETPTDVPPTQVTATEPPPGETPTEPPVQNTATESFNVTESVR